METKMITLQSIFMSYALICNVAKLQRYDSSIVIQHSLVIIVGVGQYDNDLPDISIPVHNDMRKMQRLWSEHHHTVVNTEQYYGSSLYLHRDDFLQFMNITVRSVLMANTKPYDAFLFFSSSHGDKNKTKFYSQLSVVSNDSNLS
eukprot:467063_1